MEELPDLPVLETQPLTEGVAIKSGSVKRGSLTPVPDDETAPTEDVGAFGRRNLSRDLSLLYRLALDMGSATSPEELSGGRKFLMVCS